MFFRRGVRDDQWLHAKMTLFGIGALVAVVGMVMRSEWLVGLAGLILAIGIVLRFVARPSRADEDDEPG